MFIIQAYKTLTTFSKVPLNVSTKDAIGYGDNYFLLFFHHREDLDFIIF